MILDEHDYKILAKYWKNISELEKERDYLKLIIDNENKNDVLMMKQYGHLDDIVIGIRIVYTKYLDERQKKIIDMLYWDRDYHLYQVEDVASNLDLSVRQVQRLKRDILEQTARQIGYI